MATGLPPVGMHGYQDMRYNTYVLNTYLVARPHVTLKVVERPGKFLSQGKWLKLRAVPLLFAEEFCAHITLDLSDRNLSWINLFRH